MDSLLLLCTRRIFAQQPLPTLPADLYPVLFKVAFLDGRPLVLRDLVAAWPFPELNFQRLVGHRELLQYSTFLDCIRAVIEGVVAQLRRVLKEPGCNYSLRVLDMTGLPDSVSIHSLIRESTTGALASACMEMFKYQQELPWCRSKQHKDQSRTTRNTAVLQPSGIDVHADLVVNRRSYEILHNSLQVAAAGPLRLKCHIFKAENISTSKIATLLVSLDPSCVQSVDLCFKNLEWIGLLEILSVLLPFPKLSSLKLYNRSVDVQHLTPELATGFSGLVGPLGVLPSLHRLSLGPPLLYGTLMKLSCFNTLALKRLDLRGVDVSQGLWDSLWLLLDETSSSLLHLDLRDCRMTDFHLVELLPTILHCSSLHFLGLHGNSLSTDALKYLLQKILDLPDLQLLVFPIPINCYKHDRLESGFDFAMDEKLLAAATAEFSQILANSSRTDLDWTYNPDGHDAMDYFSL